MAAASPLGALAAARRRRRLGQLDWFEAFYNAYLTGIAVVVATAVVSTLLPEGEVAASTVDRIATEGPALAGLVLAVAIGIGLRSGGRGGPIALEPPVVHHVLLSPVDRTAALRDPAVRTLRFSAFIGAGVGAVAGLAAAERIPGNPLAFVAANVATGVLTAVLAGGAALVVSGRRWPMWAADLIALALVGLSLLDVAGGTAVAPGTWLGALALAPVEVRPVAAAGVALAVAVPVVGLLGVGGTSLEAALRRAGTRNSTAMTAITWSPEPKISRGSKRLNSTSANCAKKAATCSLPRPGASSGRPWSTAPASHSTSSATASRMVGRSPRPKAS